MGVRIRATFFLCSSRYQAPSSARTGTGELYEKAFGCHCANHRHRFPSSCPGGGGLHRHLRRISMQPVESNAGSLVRLSPSRRRGPVVNASVKTPDVDAIAIARRILVLYREPYDRLSTR